MFSSFNLMQRFLTTSFKISEIVTKQYSTSFFSASNLFHHEIRKHIFNIYGFVRFSDEIVDSFHNYDKEKLFAKFESDYYDALKIGISLNPVLHAFQNTVTTYNIPDEYVKAFLDSMKADLRITDYNSKQEIDNYIYGSADVVGLMCLKVFCNGCDTLFEKLKSPAIKLGSAFQKVNFLRDLKNDTEILNRRYFPKLVNHQFDENIKNEIIQDIENDFNKALEGIKKLPDNSKLAVYTAFLYYTSLLKKIKNAKAERIINERIRISDFKKFLLVLNAIIKCKLKLI